MLELPDSPVDPIKLADWLELYALTSPDFNSSRGDLESALRVAALFNSEDSEIVEQKSLEVFGELEQRVKAADVAYPFKIDYPVLQLKSTWENFPVYTFCLCLSYFGWKPRRKETINPRKLFEQVSCLAAKRFLGGNVVGFGFPRAELPSPFPEALTAMCKFIGEGEGYRRQLSLDRKDDTLDLVVWKDFADKLPSKILMFGQCASGENWEEKLGELDPKAFWDQWMQRSLVSPLPLKSYFVPHRVEWSRWEFVARKAGIFFDRCRIAFWAHGERLDYSPHLEWSKDLLAQVAL